MSEEPVSLPSPYKGLIPYSEADAQYFFGREELRDNILASMEAFRLNLLYGASGVGKSSVLRAGVVHSIRRRTAAQLEAGERPFCVVTFNRWRDDPAAGLLNAVRRAVALYFPERPPLQLGGTLSATLERWAEEVQCEFFIVLDQFEEYFLYHPQEEGAGTLAQEFPSAVKNRNLSASFLISIREDALAKLDQFRSRLPNIFDHALRVMPLSPEEARKAIEMPLACYNELVGSGARRVTIEPELVDAILREVRTSVTVEGDWANTFGGVAPKAQIEAPYLQQVLTRLWSADAASGVLKLETYKRLGGGRKIVGSHLSSTIEQLDASEQHVAARIFRYLVTPSGTKIAQTAEDLARYSELSTEKAAAVLGKLSGTEIRILRAVAPPPDSPGAVRYEIFHDVLAAPINDWRTSYEAREREEARLQQERDTIAADTFKREQKEKAQRYRRKLVLATCIAVVLGGLSVLTFTQWRAAAVAQGTAVAAKTEAELSRDEAVRERDSARKAKAEAEGNLKDANDAKDEVQRQKDIAVSKTKDAEAAKADALKQEAVAKEEARRATIAESQLSETNRQLKLKQVELTEKQEALEREVQEKVDALTVAEQATKDADKAKRDALNKARELEITNKALSDTIGELTDARKAIDTEHKNAVDRMQAADVQTPYQKRAIRNYGSMRIDPTPTPGPKDGPREEMRPLSYPRNAAISPDAKYVATAGNDGSVRVWETDNPYEEPLYLTQAHLSDDEKKEKKYNYITAAIGQRANKDILVAATTYTTQEKEKNGNLSPTAIGVWKLELDDKGKMAGGELLYTLKGHNGLVTSLAFFSDGNFLISGSRDGTERIWNLGACSEAQELCDRSAELPRHDDDKAKPKEPVLSVAVSRDDKHVATGNTDGVTRLWVCDEAKHCTAEKPLPKRSTFAITSLDFNGDGTQIVTASEDGTARVWEVKSRGKKTTLHDRWQITVRNKPFPFPFDFDWHGRKHPSMTGAAFITGGGDGRQSPFVITSNEDGKVQVWDLETGTVVFELQGHLGRVNSAAYNPTRRLVVTAGEDDTARIWEPCDTKWDWTQIGTQKAKENFKNFCNVGKAVSELKR